MSAMGQREADWEAVLQFLKPRPPLHCPHEPTLRQQVFLRSEALEVLFGGHAGGGKSDALLMAALQYVNTPGYAAVIFRNTFADLSLPGSLMDRSHDWLDDQSDVHWNPNKHQWTFPSGATLTFGYLDKPNDHLRYKSAEFQFCVRSDTIVRMADGTGKPIRDISPGEYVDTLDGPRRVTATHRPGIKPVVEVRLPSGQSEFVSLTHRLLSTSGWASPQALAPISTLPPRATASASTESLQARPGRSSVNTTDRQPSRVGEKRAKGREGRSDFDASSVDNRTGSEEFDDARRGTLLPPAWSAQLVLHGPAVRSTQRETVGEIPLHAHGRGHSEKPSGSGSPDDYRNECGCRDGLARRTSTIGQAHTPSPADAAAPSRSCSMLDDPANIPGYTHLGVGTYAHPYTRATCQSDVDAYSAEVSIAPAGASEVCDLTVEGASHYVTSSGIVSSNCGFDEVTEIREKHYRYLFSRLRRPSGRQGVALSKVPLRMRAASNPAPNWVRRRFIEEGPTKGRIFIESALTDNPFVDQITYRKALEQLDPVERARLERGDWYAEETGSKFKKEWFSPQVGPDKLPGGGEVPGVFEGVVRYWDIAATLPSESNPDPDWTVGALVGLFEGRLYLLDIVRFRADPGDVEKKIKETAESDGPWVKVRMEQEPGASGKNTIDHYARYVLLGYDFDGHPTIRNKEARADLWAGKAKRREVIVKRGAYVTDFLDELGGFPESAPHDDQVDAVSGAHEVLTGLGVPQRRPVEIIV